MLYWSNSSLEKRKPDFQQQFTQNWIKSLKIKSSIQSDCPIIFLCEFDLVRLPNRIELICIAHLYWALLRLGEITSILVFCLFNSVIGRLSLGNAYSEQIIWLPAHYRSRESELLMKQSYQKTTLSGAVYWVRLINPGTWKEPILEPEVTLFFMVFIGWTLHSFVSDESCFTGIRLPRFCFHISLSVDEFAKFSSKIFHKILVSMGWLIAKFTRESKECHKVPHVGSKRGIKTE